MSTKHFWTRIIEIIFDLDLQCLWFSVADLSTSAPDVAGMTCTGCPAAWDGNCVGVAVLANDFVAVWDDEIGKNCKMKDQKEET